MCPRRASLLATLLAACARPRPAPAEVVTVADATIDALAGDREEPSRAEDASRTLSPDVEQPPALSGGAVILDHKDDRDLGKFCKSSVAYPTLSGSGNSSAERALNAALVAAAHVDAARCRGSSEAYPYRFETSYRVVDASHAGVVELYFERYENLAGAHGFTSGRCFVADLDAGTLTPLGAGLLASAARGKLETLTKEALEKSRSSLFDLDHLTLKDATLCVEREGIVVTFSAGLAGPWMDGPVVAPLAAADVRLLVAGTPFEIFLR